MKHASAIIFLLFTIVVSAQDSVYVNRRLTENDISVLFSYYTQDGDHSAVTGGNGTEKLQIYAPSLSFSHEIDSTHTILFDAGVDLISSASTDRIDYNMSSASYHDFHFHGTAGFSHYFKKPRTELGMTGSYDLESDYMSGGVHLWMYHTDKKAMTSYYAGLETYFDDLRWGRPYFVDKVPLTLVYPSELRDTSWFGIYMRYSYNLSLGLERVINKRMTIGFFPGINIQTGLLSTPFHRVYFIDEDKPKVENLPARRIKIPLGLKFNAYIGSSFILNTFYRFYADDFDIRSSTLEIETYYKVSPYFTPSVSLRFYQQTGSEYFSPYKEHLLSETFYTSDYDLSAFYSMKAGIGFRYSPYKRMFSGWSFDEINLVYNYYRRSDGLQAHFISTFFGIKGLRGR